MMLYRFETFFKINKTERENFIPILFVMRYKTFE